jgi:HK97 family phage major capsid protein
MSNRLKALREQKAEKFEQLEAITAKAAQEKNRPLKDDERAAFAVLEREISSLAEDIRMEEFIIAQKAGTALPVLGEGKRADKVDVHQFRRATGRLFAFRGADAEKNAYRSAMWLMATFFDNEKAAQFCRDNGIAITRAHGEAANTTGGILVPGEFVQTIIDLREEYGTFRQWANVKPMSSDKQTWARRIGGLTAYWTAEAALGTESSKTWDNVELSAKKLMAYSLISTELAEDAFISVVDDLANEMAYAFAIAEDAAGWNGDGSTTYGGVRGIVTKINDGNHTAGIYTATGHATFITLDATDLTSTMGKLPRYALRNAAWYCSQPFYQTVFSRLMVGAGGNTMENVAGPTRYSYLGYPVKIDQTLPLTATSGNISAFFGDLSLSTMMGVRRDITVKTSEHFKFLNDQLAITATERVDIVAHSLGDTVNAGPIIALKLG